jgi:hypothetical protein
VNTVVKRLSATGQERDRLCGTNWLAIRTLTIDTVPVQMPSPHPLCPRLLALRRETRDFERRRQCSCAYL